MNSFEKLKGKLAELFQLDQADLDFGIYRIMNAKRDEITRFLDRDLLPQVREAFVEYKSSDKTEIHKELDKVIEGVKAAGMDPDAAPKVKELKTQLAEAVDVTALENEVYDHLHGFFSRYYDEGDFISLRRYKEGVYAIPYEGEEVKLHWANHDQYYIKTAEYFRDYCFRLPDGRRVHFKIVEADTEKDNVKAANGKDRRFFLSGDKPIAEENTELVIRFEYRPDAEKRRQDDLNTEAAKSVLSAKGVDAWHKSLSDNWRRADGTVTDRTVLEKHLNDYTRRNTFDYFIHKDLGGFLRRELDFYIKNEVMRLDDVEEESAARVEQYLSKIKVIRRIAHKLIAFLATIEDFQRKLWLKKKFVVETNYCVTLDRVPEALYPEIARNDTQREEWVRLFAIDEIKGDLHAPKYSKPLTVRFLKANPYLVLDTKFFDQEFKDKMLTSLDDIEGKCDGLLIHSENFQALSVLNPRYLEQVRCVYIDPPYNTAASEILYKNEYRHSSWLSLLRDRVTASKHLMSRESNLCATIDDVELNEFCLVLDSILGPENEVGIVPIRINPSGRPSDTGFALTHEYALFYRKTASGRICRVPRTEDQLARFDERDERGVFEYRNLRREGANSDREDGQRQYYPIYARLDRGTIRIPEMSWRENQRDWIIKEEPLSKEVIIYPINDDGREKNWRWSEENVRADYSQFLARTPRNGTPQVYYKYRASTEGTTPLTLWTDTKYSATEHGTKTIKDLFKASVFSYPKSVYAVEDCIRVSGAADHKDSLVLDFFAGSGTTAHAVINLNREDEGNRKYILVEMGDYFDTVLKPRIQKVVYSKDWKDGKPVSRDGVSHMFKYIRLESYEDALANLRLRRTDPQQRLLDESDAFRESYMLRYMLDIETKGSPSLLDLERFDDPFSYKLLVGAGSVGETKPVNVDLVETFNWLLGLKVKHIDRIEGSQIVEGTSPKDEKVLVIWRKVRDLSEEDAKKSEKQREKSNDALEAFFKKQQYNTLDSEFDVVYVNGDNNLMNVPTVPETEGVEPRYKVRLIEEEFKRLMFDVEDV